MSGDVMRIEDLISLGSLDLKLIAGGDGRRNEVLWAHSCEMPQPQRFLGPDELLMTSGYCVPIDDDDQVTFIREIHEAGLAGLTVADHAPTPPLSQAMLDEADRRGFPILLAGVNVAYAIVARHVAAANTSSQTLQVLKLSKIYHVATRAEGDLQSLLDQLVPVLRAGLAVADPASDVVLAEARHGAADTTTARVVRLGGMHGTELTLYEFRGEEVDPFVLVHLIKLLQLIADNVINAADRRAETSEQILSVLLNGVVPADAAGRFAPYLPTDGYRVAAFPLDALRRVARAIALSDVPAVVAAGRSSGLALLPVGALQGFRAAIESIGTYVGVSSTFLELIDTRVAAVEAAKVLITGEHSGRPWLEFAGSTLAVLTRSHQEAEEIVSAVLGPLAEESQRTDVLRETLFTYLRNDRSWNATSAELQIHRQTLAYRLKRISDETGRDLNHTSDISALWIAAHAWGNLYPKDAVQELSPVRQAATLTRP